MGVTRRISTELMLTGEEEYKNQMSAVNRELQNLSSELKYADAKFKGQANTVEALTEKDRILREEIEQQEEKVRALEQAVKDAAGAYGEADKTTDGYRQSLTKAKTDLLNMEGKLRDVDKWLDEAKESSDGAAKSIDEFGREVKDVPSGGGLKDVIGSLGDLKGLVAGGVIGGAAAGIKELGDAIVGVVEDTEEYRKTMGTLENSGQQAGYSSEETAETFRQLYGVLGDTQSAATAAANLQALGLDQENLAELTEMAIGAWSRYGDSIPIDAMAESINMAFQQNEVSGALADTIDWAGGNSEVFAERLALASDKAVKQRIIMDELRRLGLDKAAEGWRDMNQDIVDANETQAEYEAAMGRLGDVLSPVADGIRQFGADAINWLADRIGELLPRVQAIIDKIQEWGRKTRENREAMAVNEAQAYEEYRARVDDINGPGVTGAAYGANESNGYSGYGAMPPVQVETVTYIDSEAVARSTARANQRQRNLAGTSMVD